jgi:hypothetical protein
MHVNIDPKWHVDLLRPSPSWPSIEYLLKQTREAILREQEFIKQAVEPRVFIPPPPEPTVSPVLAYDWEATMKSASTFMSLNAIDPPLYINRCDGYAASNQSGVTIATYDRATRGIDVYCDCARPPSIDPKLTWPGWIEDFTVLGALCHELAHHVQNLRGWKRVGRIMYNSYMQESPVSKYAKQSRSEDFAECLRLFITNPDLLRVICPMRHELFTETLKYQPTEKRTWREILDGSQERIDYVEENFHNA